MRTAFAGASAGARLPAEDSLPPGAAPEDVADEAVPSGRRFTMVPDRIKRIDRGLARMRGLVLPRPRPFGPGTV